MIYSHPSTAFDAWLTGAPTGLVGTLTVRIEDADTGTIVVADSTAGITEPRTGKYKKTFTAPSTRADYFVVWTNAATAITEELTVTDEVPSPSADAFLSVGELGDYIGRDLSADAGAAMVVEMACDVVRTAAEQIFTSVTDTVTLDGTGTDALLLPELPVNNVGTVTVNGTVAGTADYTLADNGVLIANNGTATWCSWPWYGNSPFGYGFWSGAAWPKGRQNITVTYSHGYTAGVPDDVRMVALSLSTRLLTQGPAKSENLGDQSVTYAVEATSLTPTERMICRKYKPAR